MSSANTSQPSYDTDCSEEPKKSVWGHPFGRYWRGYGEYSINHWVCLIAALTLGFWVAIIDFLLSEAAKR